MIISDLNYMEITSEADNLEGGTDWSASLTAFQQRFAALTTTATSGPAGSTATASGGLLQIGTIGLGAVVLGAP